MKNKNHKKLYLVFAIIFFTLLSGQSIINALADNGGLGASCATSTYNEFESEYCPIAWNEGGEIWMGTKGLLTHPAFVLVPLFQKIGLVDVFLIEGFKPFSITIYTYSYQSDFGSKI